MSEGHRYFTDDKTREANTLVKRPSTSSAIRETQAENKLRHHFTVTRSAKQLNSVATWKLETLWSNGKPYASLVSTYTDATILITNYTSSGPVVLSLGWVCPPEDIGQCLETHWFLKYVCWRGGAAGISQVEARDAARYPTMHGVVSITKNCSCPSVHGAEVGKSWCHQVDDSWADS